MLRFGVLGLKGLSFGSIHFGVLRARGSYRKFIFLGLFRMLRDYRVPGYGVWGLAYAFLSMSFKVWDLGFGV